MRRGKPQHAEAMASVLTRGDDGSDDDDGGSSYRVPLLRDDAAATAASPHPGEADALLGGAAPGVGVRRVILAFVASALGGSLYGYDVGSTATVTTQEQLLGDFGIRANSWQQGVVVSASLYGALIASFCLFLLGECLGRKQEILLADALYMVGSIASAAAPAGDGAQVLLVVLARGIYGMGIGLAMHSVPAYIAEISPPRYRGLLIALKEAMIVLGMLLGYFVGFLCDRPHGWRTTWVAGCVLAVASAAGMAFMPESPRWMASRDLSRARGGLQFLRGADAPTPAIEAELQRAAEASDGWDEVPLLDKLRELWGVRKAFYIGGGLLFFQQISGQPSVLYFAPTIFENAGLGAQASKFWSVLIGFVKLLATSIAGFSVDSYGRVPLLVLGIVLMVASLGKNALVRVRMLTRAQPISPPPQHTHHTHTTHTLSFPFPPLASPHNHP